MADDFILEQATLSDIMILAKLRRLMFEDMAAAQGKNIGSDLLDTMEEAYVGYLKEHLADQSSAAWVVESNGQIIACGVASFLAWPPFPGDTSGKAALLYNLYVTPQYQRRGIARQIMVAMIEYCRARGVRLLKLNATPKGRHLYEMLGFLPDDTAMNLFSS